MRSILSFYIIFINYFVSSGSEQVCARLLTCGDCISYPHDQCVWCSHKEHLGERCQSKTYVEENKFWCEEQVYDPQLDVQLVKNDTFNTGEDGFNVVQLKPQNLNITVRPGVPANFVMSYKPAKDFPLDIYYVIDSSYTMIGHRKKLEEQGLQIYTSLTKLNNNVRLGLGSFIEKPGMPFVDPTTSDSYAFKNNVKLTQNMSQFTEAVKNIEVYGNYDDPEAGMDALMQAMVCKEEVGWRDEARRIIVFSTDNTYHSAGEGKLVGAYEPNDMKCHLEKNTYSKSLVYDYPSISQINKIAMDNNIKIIFTIVESARYHYEPFEGRIRGAKVVSLNSTDAVGTIIEEYKELVRNVLLESDLPSYIRIMSEPDCTKMDNALCNLNQDKSLDMNITMVIDECPKNVEKQEVKIGINSLQEKLHVHVKVDCECECEKTGRGVENSTECYAGGTYQCGVCKCNENRYGSTCRCKGTSTDTSDTDKCTAKNETIPCSGRGICRCGKCEDCKKGFSGEFCQFDDNSCVRPGGKLCSGNGQCKFGNCECRAGWSKSSQCACPDHNRSCISPQSKEVCAGNGYCSCGKCECTISNTTNDYCTGKFCENCKKENLKICRELEDYAECVKSENKTQCDEIYTMNSTLIVKIMNRTEIDANVAYYSAKHCTKVLKDGSILVFIYDYSTEPPILIIQDELDLPSHANLWMVIGSSIGGVLLIGILTVIAWKYLIDLHDAKEYKKFKTKASAAGYDVQNPLYESPISNTLNPAFETK